MKWIGAIFALFVFTLFSKNAYCQQLQQLPEVVVHGCKGNNETYDSSLQECVQNLQTVSMPDSLPIPTLDLGGSATDSGEPGNPAPPAPAPNQGGAQGNGQGGGGIVNNNYYSQQNQQNQQNSQQAQANSNECSQAQKSAYQCCTNPSSCFTNTNGTQGSSAITQVIQMALGVGAQLPGSISQMCGRVKGVDDVSSAINVYLANQCRTAISNCENACGNNQTSDNVCDRYSQAEIGLTVQALRAQLASKFETICQNAVAATGQNAFDNPDCSTPAEAATPFCQYKCNQPGMAESATCAGLIPTMPTGTGGLNVNNQSSIKNPFDGAIDAEPDPAQIPPMGNNPQTTQLATTPQATADDQAQLPSLGSGYGGAAAQQQATTPKGWNTNIMHGFSAGTGYTMAMATPTGGYVAPSYNASGQKLNPLGQPFDLKAFLPGGKKAQTALSIYRGPSSIPGGINPSGIDIFQDISNRYYELCLNGKLMSGPCAPLIKYHAQTEEHNRELRASRLDNTFGSRGGM